MFKPRKGSSSKKTFFTARGLVGPRKNAEDDTVESPSYRKSRVSAKVPISLSDSFSSSSSGDLPSDEEGSHDDPTIFMASTDEDDLEDHLNVGCIDSLFFPGPRDDKESLFSFKRFEPETIEDKAMPLALAYMKQFSPHKNNLESVIEQLNCKGPERKCTPGEHAYRDVDDDVLEMDQAQLESAMPTFFKSLMSLSDGSSEDYDESDRGGLAFLARPPALYLTNGTPAAPAQGSQINPSLRHTTDYPLIESLPSQILVQEQPSYGGDSILSFEMIALGELSIHGSASRVAASTVTAEQRQQYLAMNYGSALLSEDSDESNPAHTESSGFDESEQLSEKENDGHGDTTIEAQKYSVTSPRKYFRDTLTSKPVQHAALSKLTQKQHEPTENTLIANPWIGAAYDTFDLEDQMYPSFDEGPSRQKKEALQPPPSVLTEENGRNYPASSPRSPTFQARAPPRANAESLQSQNMEPRRARADRSLGSLNVESPSNSALQGRETPQSSTPKSLQAQIMKSPRSAVLQVSSSPRHGASNDSATPHSFAMHSRLRGEQFDYADLSQNGTRTKTTPSSMYSLSHRRRSPMNPISLSVQGQSGFEKKGLDNFDGDELMGRPMSSLNTISTPNHTSSDEAGSQSNKDCLAQSELKGENGEKRSPPPETSTKDKDASFWKTALGLSTPDTPAIPKNNQAVVAESERGKSKPNTEARNTSLVGKDPTSLEELLDALSVGNKTKATADCSASFDEQTTTTQFFEAKMA
jgi:hypothetical protein